MKEQKSVGKLKGTGNPVWHTNEAGSYWCGNWANRTAEELFEECKSIIIDLIIAHPELTKRKSTP